MQLGLFAIASDRVVVSLNGEGRVLLAITIGQSSIPVIVDFASHQDFGVGRLRK
jgi:hypothetical protein